MDGKINFRLYGFDQIIWKPINRIEKIQHYCNNKHLMYVRFTNVMIPMSKVTHTFDRDLRLIWAFYIWGQVSRECFVSKVCS